MKRLSLFVMTLAIFGLASCHSAAPSTAVTCTTTTATTSSAASSSSCIDPVTGISVTISPVTISVNVVTSTQFSAYASGGTNTIIIWKVNNITGGNSTVGTIDSNGNYHAPNVVPSPATVTISATSFEDTLVSATSTVTITPPPVVTISPTSWTMPSGVANSKAFTSTVTGALTTNEDWYVGAVGTNPILGGNATLGTVDANGVYTAPRTPPLGSNVIVTAVSRDFPLSTASAAVILSGYTASSLQGQFAFTVSGQIASGAFFRAGSFTADGAGNLTGGLEDINETSGVTPALSFVGTYSVTSDGRGTLQFLDGHSPTTFDFGLVNGTQLQIVGFDTTGTASGQANLRDNTTFSAAALSSTYVFDFTGTHGSNTLSQIGEFAADGLGNITGGLMDISDGGVPTPQVPITGGAYSVSSATGRGTATLVTSATTLHFSFYIVSRGSAKFVGTDATQSVVGATLQQTPDTTFDKTSLNGKFVFLLSGWIAGKNVTTLASFTADGNGGLSAGMFDENTTGLPSPGFNSAFSAGTYTVASNGRGTMSFTAGRPLTLVFYLGAAGTNVIQENDAGTTSDGLFLQQQTAAFSGNFALQSSGFSGASRQMLQGELGANTSGAISSGSIDINTAGALVTGEAVTGTYTTPTVNGRSVLILNPLTDNRNFAMYVVNSNLAFVVGTDVGRLAAGALYRQF